MEEAPSPVEHAPYRLVVFWKEDARTKKTFLQYREVQVAMAGEGEDAQYEFYPLALSALLDELLKKWREVDDIKADLGERQTTIAKAEKLFDEAIQASDNPHCETYVAQTALNFLTTVELLFNAIYFAEALPLFFDQATVTKAQQTGALYIWLDPYLGGISHRSHKPLDTEEAIWPAKEEFYCYFKRKSDPTVSPQQLANIWRTNASRIVEMDEECRAKLWEWLKGHKFSEEEIRALILP